ncbi:uncharacterized protein [Mytilus edulis]|uniref:uncharacterized protein n=1 Tax=Mytilus edulis TaxID=6550 RepID=UPI0039EEDD58
MPLCGPTPEPDQELISVTSPEPVPVSSCSPTLNDGYRFDIEEYGAKTDEKCEDINGHPDDQKSSTSWYAMPLCGPTPRSTTGINCQDTNPLVNEAFAVNNFMSEVDLPSESTDNYQHNIPVQEFQGSSGTKEPANEDQPSTSPEKNLEQDPDQIPDIENELETREERERKLLENNIKHLYKSHIKVLKWTIQPSNISVHESVTTQRTVNRKPSTCKRKLFESEISNTETAPRRKKTTFDLVVQLLGPSSDVDDCIKYRELKLKHPGHKSFVSAFDQSFTKLQIEVSKRYFALKDKTAKDEGKENRENL